jgi:hypothetical protein
MLLVAIGLPEVLIEGIANRPAAALTVEGLGRDQQVREPACEDLRQNRAWVCQEGKLLVQQQVGDIGGSWSSENRFWLFHVKPRLW